MDEQQDKSEPIEIKGHEKPASSKKGKRGTKFTNGARQKIVNECVNLLKEGAPVSTVVAFCVQHFTVSRVQGYHYVKKAQKQIHRDSIVSKAIKRAQVGLSIQHQIFMKSNESSLPDITKAWEFYCRLFDLFKAGKLKLDINDQRESAEISAQLRELQVAAIANPELSELAHQLYEKACSSIAGTAQDKSGPNLGQTSSAG